MKTIVKFFNGRKLVGTITTTEPTKIINHWKTHPDVPEWTRYKIITIEKKGEKQ
jgi:hypothetical protein